MKKKIFIFLFTLFLLNSNKAIYSLWLEESWEEENIEYNQDSIDEDNKKLKLYGVTFKEVIIDSLEDQMFYDVTELGSIVVIWNIDENSMFFNQRVFRRFDIIEQVNGEPVRNIESFKVSMRKSIKTGLINILLNNNQLIPIPIQESC